LKHYIPQACIVVNSEHPYSIGKTLHVAVFQHRAPTKQSCIEYEGSDIDRVESAVLYTLPSYTLYKTETESIQANEPAYSLVYGARVMRFIDNTPKAAAVFHQTATHPHDDKYARAVLGEDSSTDSDN
jgi:hypothetical protein